MTHLVKSTLRKQAPIWMLAATLPLGGCASLLSDNTYDVSIVSAPADASFVVTDGQGKLVAEGVTPAIVPLDSFVGFYRRAKYHVTYSHDEYPDKSMTLKSTVSPLYYLNFLFGVGAGFGIFIDPFTGAMFDLPKAANVNFESSVDDQKAKN